MASDVHAFLQAWNEFTVALVALPVIVFFLFVQGRMTSGLVSGAVKG